MTFCSRKFKMLCGMSVLIVMFIAFLEFRSWTDQEKVRKVKELTFSRESGFYEEEFELEMEAGSGIIYYTLDGSIPDRNSIKYEKPILIKDASENDNVYSMRTDVSTGFDKQEIERISYDYPGYQPPDYKIDKATIVRAVVYNELGRQTEIKTASYFVGFSQKDGYDGMNVLSIVTEPSNLFDYETGIYVKGKTYDDYVKEYRNGDEYYWREEFWTLWMANYRNRGKKWEREASCQFFDENGRLVCEQECGIRIHGGASRGYNPRSLNIYARKEYDGNKYFQGDFFGTGYYASAVTLFQGGNDVRTKAKDYLVSAVIKDMQVSSMNYEPYVLFLNGEYWGWYWLNEKYNADYLEYYYNVGRDNVILIKNGGLEEGEEEDFQYYEKMIEFCSQGDISNDDVYRKVCELIDEESCIDYYAVMLYLGRHGDWPDSNYALWRVKKEENSPFGDGKWRWMIFDLNSAGFNFEIDPIEYVMDNDKVFSNLMTNGQFRTQLLKKIEELTDTVFCFEKIDENINQYLDFISEPMKKNDKRFFGDESLNDFNAEMEAQRHFFAQRKEFLLPILDKYR